MGNNTCEIVGAAAWSAIQDYADMSGFLVAPEAFIQSSTAIQIRKKTRGRVSVELPIRTLLNEWSVNRDHLQGLGNFRIDMATYDSDFDSSRVNLNALIEFKLWTNRFHVAADVRRLKQIIKAVKELGTVQAAIDGFVVICPQYHQGLAAVQGAVSDFRQRFPIAYEKVDTILPANGIAYGVGVAVIDVHECVEGQYG